MYERNASIRIWKDSGILRKSYLSATLQKKTRKKSGDVRQCPGRGSSESEWNIRSFYIWSASNCDHPLADGLQWPTKQPAIYNRASWSIVRANFSCFSPWNLVVIVRATSIPAQRPDFLGNSVTKKIDKFGGNGTFSLFDGCRQRRFYQLVEDGQFVMRSNLRIFYAISYGTRLK